MTRDLASEIAVFLADRGEAPAAVIARGVRARRADVLHALHGSRFHVRPGPRGQFLYQLSGLAARAAGPAGNGIPVATQCQRLLAVLSDGRPHRSLDLYRMGLGVIHSRIADLRARGHEIACWLEVTGRGDRVYLYRLGGPGE